MKDVLERTAKKSATRGRLMSRSLADLLRERMRAAGIDAVGLAADCRVATNTVHRVLRGETEPSGSLLASLIVLLGIERSDLEGVRVNPRGDT